jgi:hypothetical protein
MPFPIFIVKHDRQNKKESMMTENNSSLGDNPFKKEPNEYPSDANPYHQNSYDQNNPYQQAPVQGAYPPAPPTQPVAPYGQPQYNNDPYQGQQVYNAAPYGYVAAVNPEAKSKADYAMVFGLIGIFFFSLIFGILALVYAKKAEELGADAKVGKILGWVDIGLSMLGFLWFLLFFPLMLAGGSSSGY